MRAIRFAFFVILAVVLVLVAAANREMIAVSLLPPAVAPFAGGTWSLTMPAFVALFLAMVFGVLVGLVWEWLREFGQRAEARAMEAEIARLQRELGKLKVETTVGKDEVLALLDATVKKR